MQQIIIEKPPLYCEIASVFRIYGRRDVIFSWGDRIFNPFDQPLPPDLLAHEAIHGRRQTNNEQAIRDWWKRYMEDLEFRLDEEMAAHRAEYQWLMSHGTREQRRSALKHVASKISSPLYGHMISPADAREGIRNARA